MAKVEGGFPHSEIRGSKPVRGSPRLIAAYHVLHRLSAPRHPPDTLMTLDHSHHRCPSGEPRGSPTRQGGHRRSAPHCDATGPSTGWTQDLCFQTCPRRDAVKLPVTCRILRGPSHDGKAMQLDRPTRFRPLRQASLAGRPDPRVGHIHSSRCRTTRRARSCGDAPAGSTSGEFLVLRTGSVELQEGVQSTTLPRSRNPGGARRDRTDDLMLAKHALYRLSYCPSGVGDQRSVTGSRPDPRSLATGP